MKMAKAMKIIEATVKPGFIVIFEWAEGSILRGDNFPDVHADEQPIATEEEAWELARKFADQKPGVCVNLYVATTDFHPVPGYKDRLIANR